MFSEASSGIISQCWSRHFGWEEEDGPLWASPTRLLSHGGELMNYHGVMAMDGPGGSVVSVPETLREKLEPALLAPDMPPTVTATQLPAEIFSAVIGPAYIGYAEVVTGIPLHPVQLLGPKDEPHVGALQDACDATEWDHGGSTAGESAVMCGVFAGEILAALAGYEIWNGTVAHISIITHPEHRGQGYGHSAVAFLAKHALWKNLLPQYRTLEANTPSMAIARSLGFEHFATSVAVHLRGGG